MGNKHPSIAPYETLATQDAPLAIAVGNNRQFRALVTSIGVPGLAVDKRFASNSDRVRHRRELIRELEAALSADTAASWAQRLQAAGIPCGPLNDLSGAIDLANRLGLDPIASFDGTATEPGISTLANPVRLSATPVHYRRRPPSLGADTGEVRAWLSADDDPSVLDGKTPLADGPDTPPVATGHLEAWRAGRSSGT
jgi:crotonobetainyl-CoA:carnitine CoA-transferase CaiB-like acyl-CoA transferase